MLARSASMRHLTLRMKTRSATILAVTTVLAAFGAFKVSKDEGLRRAIHMQSVAIPPLVKYRYCDWRTRGWPQEERDAAFNELHDKYSKVAYDLFMDLQGFYVKFAQIIAGMDNTGQAPKQYVDRMKAFQNNCPAIPVNECVKVIERELGKPFDQVFLSIDPVPLGSASIGQVHKAKLLNGQVVAVKIQHSDAERFFRADVAASRAFTAIAQPEQLALFDEIEKQFVSEFDYTLEAKNLRDMNTTLENSPEELRQNIVIPKPLIATRKVLVMTFVPGKTLFAQQKQFIRALAEKQNKSEASIEEEFIERIKSGNAPKPPSANALRLYKTALRSRDFIRNGFALSYNVAIGNWIGAKMAYEWSELPMNADSALRTLYSFFGYSMFRHGIFSSDPHGGNVMYVQSGQVGLIDMGQVKRLPLEQRIKFARLVVGLSNDDDSPACTEQIATLWRECGYDSVKGDPQVTADLARFLFDRMDDDLLNKYGGAAVALEQMGKKDPQKHLPDDFVMCFRASCLLRMNAMGLGYGLDKGLYSRVSPLWAPYALELLAENGVQPPPRVDSRASLVVKQVL